MADQDLSRRMPDVQTLHIFDAKNIPTKAFEFVFWKPSRSQTRKIYVSEDRPVQVEIGKVCLCWFEEHAVFPLCCGSAVFHVSVQVVCIWRCRGIHGIHHRVEAGSLNHLGKMAAISALSA